MNSDVHIAARDGDDRTIRRFIHSGNNINTTNALKQTPLHMAAAGGQRNIVEALVQAGANVNVTDDYMETPLHMAARGGYFEVVEILIRNGASLNQKDKKYEQTALHSAASAGHIDIVELLTQKGADVNVLDKNQDSPLIRAAEMGYNEIAETLIQADAKVNVKNSFYETPLHRAAEGGYIDVIETLLQAGADISATNKLGRNAKACSKDMDTKTIIEEYEEAITNAPAEVKDLGLKAALAYVRALREDSAVSNVIRVMLVGNFGVGKTTIAMNLLERTVQHIDSTDGIDVFFNQCLYDTETETWHKKGQSDQSLFRLKDFVRIDITDFAGQLIYYTTHQTYLTSRGLYLLVFNVAMGLESEVCDEDLYPGKSQLRRVIDFLEFWITTIVTYANDERGSFPRIILIGTHKDKVSKNTSDLDVLKRSIRERFSDFIRSSQLVMQDDLFITAENMSNETRKAIRKVLLKEGMEYPDFGKKMPASWITLQEKLMELKEQKSYIVRLDYVRYIIGGLRNPIESGELAFVLRYLHNMGIILYFDAPNLRDKIILDPKLVIDAMKCFITCESSVFQILTKRSYNKMRKSGKVKKTHILKMWNEKGTQEISEHAEHLLEIMKKLDLICEPMLYNKGEKMAADFFLVPCMMDAIQPKDCSKQINRGRGLLITFTSSTILPPAIFNRLACSCLAFWEIFEGHFYNGLVILRSGRNHLLEMKRDVKQIIVTLAHTQPTRHPDAQWCLAIKFFLERTIDNIVSVYSTSLTNPISCDSGSIDALLNIQPANEDECDNQFTSACRCQKYDNHHLKDVNLMRIAEKLRRIGLGQLCSALLNDSAFSDQIEIDYKAFKSDVKAFYVLQEWKHKTFSFTVPELRRLFKEHMEDVNEHIICQAMQNETFDSRSFTPTTIESQVYPEFLSVVAEYVTFKYMHLGLELGLTLTEIERLQIENSRTLEITRTMLEMWYNANKEVATVLKLAMAFQRCGVRNLDWMENEYDVKLERKKTCVVM